MTNELGMCDKRQYEHTGPHRLIPENGQNVPPFPYVNWHAVAEPDAEERRWSDRVESLEVAIHTALQTLGKHKMIPDIQAVREKLYAAVAIQSGATSYFEAWYQNLPLMQKNPCSTTNCMKESYRLAWKASHSAATVLKAQWEAKP